MAVLNSRAAFGVWSKVEVASNCTKLRYRSRRVRCLLQNVPAPRKFMSADGEVKFGQPVLLSDFLEDMRL